MLSTLLQDVRYSFRMLRKRPGFTLVVMLTLAVGIGTNTAIFSVVNAVLIRPLPYQHPERLVRVYTEFPTMNLRKFWMSPPEFMDISKEAKSWESIGAWATGGVNVGTEAAPIRVASTLATRGLIETLGVSPMLGRNFSSEEDVPNGPLTAIISHDLWQNSMGGQSDIIGKPIRINERVRTVVGVMPRDFNFPPGTNDPVQVWTPAQIDPANPGGRGSHFLYVIGRLKPGITIEQAQAEMGMLQTAWMGDKRAQHLLNQNGHPSLMVPLHDDVVGGAKTAVLMLLGAVGFVLLIACANVASLLLARAEARHREFAVRLALGAGRARMLRQFLTEGTILVLFGAASGVLLAQLCLKLILSTAPDSVPRAGEIGVDLTVLAFTLGIAIVSIFLFALAPMMQLRERNLAAWLHGSTRGSVGVSNQWLRKALVVTEIALAVVLVVGSGLMIRAFWKLQQVNLGFDPDGLLAFSVNLPGSKYPVAERLRFAKTLEERLAALPGVKSATQAGELPPLRPIDANDTDIEDYKSTPNGPAENVDFWNVVGENYFKTLGIRTMEGRVFESPDRNQNSQLAVVINQSLARRFWQGSPIGRRLSPGFGGPTPTWFTVVGVVEDTKNLGVAKPAGTELYFLQPQLAAFPVSSQMNFVISASGDPIALAGAVRAAVRELDAGLPIYEMKTMSDLVGESLVRPRFLSLLLFGFSAMALLLATVGIYGVMAYSVSQRTQEIGVRMALGARSGDILRMVLGQGGRLTIAGLGLGLIGAMALTRLMATLLFEVSVTDPTTFATVAVLLATVALLACYLPARRAMKVDPMLALRYE
ncbi:MAG: ABC transporter permease [Acidobacteriota bacterium]